MMSENCGGTGSQNPSAGSFDYIAKMKIQLGTSSGKILIVDDERFNCDIIYGFLMILGFPNRKENTHFAYNGE